MEKSLKTNWLHTSIRNVAMELCQDSSHWMALL